jgi:hypothetical protein
MSKFSTEVLAAATKAVFELQYPTNKAAGFVRSEVPQTSFEMAVEAINLVARPSKVKVAA